MENQKQKMERWLNELARRAEEKRLDTEWEKTFAQMHKDEIDWWK